MVTDKVYRPTYDQVARIVPGWLVTSGSSRIVSSTLPLGFNGLTD